MKYFYLVLFNIIAFYILTVFIFGNGGIADNINKIQILTQLENKKLSEEIELENLKSKLNYLKGMNAPDSTSLAEQGKKKRQYGDI